MIIGIIFIVVVGLYLIFTYNRLVGLRNRIKESFAAIEVYLQNRYDALLKVAETVSAYTSYEQDTLVEITKLRVAVNDQQTPAEKIKTFTEMEKTIHSINIQAENYPELKASENYIQLQHTVNNLEEKLSASRRTYNSNIANYNTAIESFPTKIFAGMFGFQAEVLLEIEDSKKVDVDLKSILRG